MNKSTFQVKVAIITAIKNGEKYITECINSVKEELISHNNDRIYFHHFIWDGLSEDNTVDVIHNASHKDLTLYSGNDLGLSDALNKLIALIPTSYNIIYWINADDAIAPGSFSQVSKYLSGDWDILYGNTIQVSGSGEIIRKVKSRPYCYFFLATIGCYIPSSGTFYKSQLLRDNKLSTNLRYVMDYELFLRIRHPKFTYYHLNSYLTLFRVHSEALSHNKIGRKKERVKVQRKYGMRLSNHFKAAYLQTMIIYYLFKPMYEIWGLTRNNGMKSRGRKRIYLLPLFRNFIFQGSLYMSNVERNIKLLIELFLAGLLLILINSISPGNIIASLLFSSLMIHVLSWIFLSNFWVALIFYTSSRVENNIANCKSYMTSVSIRAIKCKSVKGIYVYGSYARNEMNPYSDLDLRVVSHESLVSRIFASLFTMKERIIASIFHVPLDIFLASSDEDLNKLIEKPLKLVEK